MVPQGTQTGSTETNASPRQRTPVEEQKSLYVLTADLVGYSERVLHDARRGVDALVETRGILIDAVRRHRGKVVSTPGDFLLAVFDDALASVAAAVEGQQRLLQRNDSLPGEQEISWRVGIAFGDVFRIGQDVYGHAVNVAARIQALGRPGDILVSDDVEARLRKIEFPTESLGPHYLKNIAAAIAIHRLRWPGSERSATAQREKTIAPEVLRRLAKPTLKIEPFEVARPSDRKALMARGIEDDLHVVLSRLSSSINVIDRGSGGTNFAVDYLLKGSLQSSGHHLRVTARLVSVASGASIWAERHDCDMRKGFHILDDMAREIVVGLQLALTEGEQARFWRRGTDSGIAWEKFQTGRDQESRYTRHGHRRARQCYEEAVAHDPAYLSALVALGFCHLDEIRLGWSEDDAASLGQAEQAYERARLIEADHPDVLSLLAFIRQVEGRSGEARAAMGRAVAAADQNSEIIAYQGALYELMGDFPAALRAYARALSLTAHAKPWICANLGLCHLAMGHVVEAERIYRNVVEHYPEYTRAWIGLAVALERRKSHGEAQRAAARVLELDPCFTVAGWSRSRPFSEEMMLAAFVEDMRKAGLP